MTLIVIIVLLAVAFDFINGFHDTANSIATSISTKALSPRFAVIYAGVLNFAGALVWTEVAKSIGGKIADPSKIDNGVEIVMAALISAIAWNLITWYYGIPSSSSHALIGSLTGAVFAGAGASGVDWGSFASIVQALILAPVLAFCLGFLVMKLLKWIVGNLSPHRVNRWFRFLQIFSAGMQAFTHGGNDAQKAMGILVFALVAGGFQTDLEVPLWVKIVAATAMGIGTSVGGWRIIKTVSSKIIKIEPLNGFSADLTSSVVVQTATALALPVSTTHVVSSGIMGTGAAKQFYRVHWRMAGRIILTWLITIPICAVLAGLGFWLIDSIF
ncbi:inorganic phosphate transporter [Effusibacillus lacus]|uniref:Inorganic phosphate transporter n=1 Tax=Effusibacillus lacus TaxID=1348429 RepID=A0A292YKI1_9BACL|nr:inorganic phosphate transporter [Effusibacillus lacus]TCS69802.1 PiT family inorganic phosphate transporter [Effusibacillus lacus]GAX88884.1 inorganic phosphate transporter [Effusibacillus lacus]